MSEPITDATRERVRAWLAEKPSAREATWLAQYEARVASPEAVPVRVRLVPATDYRQLAREARDE